MIVQPINDQVLVELDIVEEKSKGGLFLPVSEDAKVAKSTGIVKAIGDNKVIHVKIGDHVVLEKSMGRRFSIPTRVKDVNGYEYTKEVDHILISFYDIIALIED